LPLGKPDMSDLTGFARPPLSEQGLVMDEVNKQLDAAFVWRGHQGSVHVGCVANTDPSFWGCWSSIAEGFPVCTATVEFPSLGYRSMLGWVQLVRSTDNDSAGTQFELDPFALFGDAPSPYCWYGQRPILFDAPSRQVRQPLEWVAHSFLAITPLDEVAQWKPRRVVPIIGFSWGFTDDGSSVILHDMDVLPAETWATHLELLRHTYARWVFADSLGA
jgi:hypothetical protein